MPGASKKALARATTYETALFQTSSRFFFFLFFLFAAQGRENQKNREISSLRPYLMGLPFPCRLSFLLRIYLVHVHELASGNVFSNLWARTATQREFPDINWPYTH